MSSNRAPSALHALLHENLQRANIILNEYNSSMRGVRSFENLTNDFNHANEMFRKGKFKDFEKIILRILAGIKRMYRVGYEQRIFAIFGFDIMGLIAKLYDEINGGKIVEEIEWKKFSAQMETILKEREEYQYKLITVHEIIGECVGKINKEIIFPLQQKKILALTKLSEIKNQIKEFENNIIEINKTLSMRELHKISTLTANIEVKTIGLESIEKQIAIVDKNIKEVENVFLQPFLKIAEWLKNVPVKYFYESDFFQWKINLACEDVQALTGHKIEKGKVFNFTTLSGINIFSAEPAVVPLHIPSSVALPLSVSESQIAFFGAVDEKPSRASVYTPRSTAFAFTVSESQENFFGVPDEKTAPVPESKRIPVRLMR